MPDFKWIPKSEFNRMNDSDLNDNIKYGIIADMCRANTLTSVKIAGSGHLGSSFSAMDIVVYLYYKQMNTIELGFDNLDRDIYFSSKGHDVPGLYSVLYSLGVLTRKKLIKLRRLEGLDGHPDISIQGIEANSGSLGMGISKAKGMAIAKRLSGNGGSVYVLTGDGELQEGQIYESLQSAAHHKVSNLIAIVDHNKVQSDKQISEITDLGNLEEKLASFGWHVVRCDGHDYGQLDNVMRIFTKITDKPKVLIADTIKGKGISFMEHPNALVDGKGLYQWHSGAPDDTAFVRGFDELIDRINSEIQKYNLDEVKLEKIPTAQKTSSGVSKEYVADAFGETLLEIVQKNEKVVVLDADLAADCRIRRCEEAYPDRFIECGIAEQDMVSTAGGLAIQGYIPIVNSFAAFLASRANEQIYTNASENTKIIYVCHYAGLIPAGPGKSHQSIRDISLFGALPNFEIIQPCNAIETEQVINYCVNEATQNCMIRLIIGPSPQIIKLPDNYKLKKGEGTILNKGSDAISFSYGPVMINEALEASKILAEKSFSLQVVNMPWLNQTNIQWLERVISGFDFIYIIEDHSQFGGLGHHLLKMMSQTKHFVKKQIRIFSVDGFPAWGSPKEVLNFHGLDAVSISNEILKRK